jgi:hypothetical protein
MPSNQGILLDDGQRLPPFQEPREQRHVEANCIGRSPWSLLPFQIQGQLLPQEQIFSGERTSERSPVLTPAARLTRGKKSVRTLPVGAGNTRIATIRPGRVDDDGKFGIRQGQEVSRCFDPRF